jgi:predicted amidohydrolase YtcJ
LKADCVVVNGSIHTMNPEQPLAAVVAMAHGRVVAVGDDAAAREWIGPRTEVLDLKGRTALPGLTDAHLHFVAYALSLQQVDLLGVRSPEEATRRVEVQVAQKPAGEWVLGQGWNRNLWPNPAFPRREWLDAIARGHPVALASQDMHSLWVNSLALERLGIGAEACACPVGQILRDTETGEPTGMLLEGAAAMALSRVGLPGSETLRRAVLQAGQRVQAMGLTAVHDCEGAAELSAFMDLWREEALPLRVYMMLPRENLDAAIALGLRTGYGDAWLRLGHLKLFSDGSLGTRTADMLEPYVGEGTHRGMETLDSATLMDLTERASRAGIAVATHAIGDRGNRRVLDVYERTRPLWAARGLRPRIEHVQIVDDADLGRLARLGVIASMQPVHATSDMHMAEAHWGPRCTTAYAWRSLLQAGTHLAFGSDAPVESPDPLAGIYAAVTRKRADGTPPGGWRPEQCLSVEEAVYGFTLGAAYASSEEREKGSLEEGKVADLVVLSEDIFRGSPDALRDARVLTTVLGGRVVHDVR